MTKQTVLGRVTQLARAGINALIGNLRLVEEDHREDVDAAGEWGRKALAASRKADELRGRAWTPTRSTTSPRWRWDAGSGPSRRRRRPTFEQLDSLGDSAEVEARLTGLKSAS